MVLMFGPECQILASGMDKADRQKTVFVSLHGLFELRVMPFGFCNAPATFERLMESILAGLSWEI